MNQPERNRRIRITARLSRPWRRFVRLRAGGRNRIALAWQQTSADCCRQISGTG